MSGNYQRIAGKQDNKDVMLQLKELESLVLPSRDVELSLVFGESSLFESYNEIWNLWKLVYYLEAVSRTSLKSLSLEKKKRYHILNEADLYNYDLSK